MAHTAYQATLSGSGNQGLQVGQNLGQINFHPPKRPETPPAPSLLITFGRDADFVDRGTILGQIHQLCGVPGSRTALVGLGGVGKSQLAIEYAYQKREQSPETWVFWVHASNAARFEQSYRDIADKAKIFGRQDPETNIFKLVRDWLHDDRREWVLILDNVDDAGFLCEAQSGTMASRPLRDYLPQCPNGVILLTSRSREAASKLAEARSMVEIGPMSDADALSLLEKKLGPLSSGQDVPALAAALEYMPLAIVQASAYISQQAPRCSVRQYLERFHRNDREKMTLLDYEGGELRRDTNAQNSIMITWQLSFNHIRQAVPSAADLLSLMSFFDRQGIPEKLLRDRIATNDVEKRSQQESRADVSDDEDGGSDSELEIDQQFDDDVTTLRSYSLVSISVSEEGFEMHSLVQLATRKWLKANGQLEKWNEQYIERLGAAFPDAEFENWSECRLLFPHAKAAIKQQPRTQNSLGQWAGILHRAAHFARDMGSRAEALDIALKVMKTKERLYGREHKETSESIRLVGSIRALQGQWKEAEKLQVEAMEISRRLLGDEHPDTLISIGNLALTYYQQGRWGLAEELHTSVLEARKRVLGDTHPATLTSMGQLGLTYREQGRWKESEKLHIQALETSKRVLGDTHPDTLVNMGNLALTYRIQGRWKEAEKLQVQAMETSKRVRGDENPNTLTSMNNLALTYRNQGRWKEAEKLQVQATEASKRVSGDEHPNTLNSISNLALTYYSQRRWKEAEKLQVQVMEISKRVFGAESLHTLTNTSNLAVTYHDQGRWKEAEELQVQVTETSKRLLGDEHPATLNSMHVLASAYYSQGRWKEAEELQVEVIELRKRVLGDEHPETLTSMGNLAFTWKGVGRATEAITLMEACVQRRKRVLGADHPRTISSSEILLQWKAEENDSE